MISKFIYLRIDEYKIERNLISIFLIDKRRKTTNKEIQLFSFNLLISTEQLLLNAIIFPVPRDTLP